jgi:hypothetical protein
LRSSMEERRPEPRVLVRLWRREEDEAEEEG